MARPDKVAAVAELKEKFSSAGATVLTEYRGLSVSALKDLRRSLGVTPPTPLRRTPSPALPPRRRVLRDSTTSSSAPPPSPLLTVTWPPWPRV